MIEHLRSDIVHRTRPIRRRLEILRLGDRGRLRPGGQRHRETPIRAGRHRRAPGLARVEREFITRHFVLVPVEKDDRRVAALERGEGRLHGEAEGEVVARDHRETRGIVDSRLGRREDRALRRRQDLPNRGAVGAGVGLGRGPDQELARPVAVAFGTDPQCRQRRDRAGRGYAAILLDPAGPSRHLPSGLAMAQPAPVQWRVAQILGKTTISPRIPQTRRILVSAALLPLTGLSAGTITLGAAPSIMALSDSLTQSPLDRHIGQLLINAGGRAVARADEPRPAVAADGAGRPGIRQRARRRCQNYVRDRGRWAGGSGRVARARYRIEAGRADRPGNRRRNRGPFRPAPGDRAEQVQGSGTAAGRPGGAAPDDRGTAARPAERGGDEPATGRRGASVGVPIPRYAGRVGSRAVDLLQRGWGPAAMTFTA